MNGFLEQFSEFLKRLPPRQKLALAVVLLGSIAILAGVGYWASRPDYALLFSNLKPSEASRAIETLTDQGVKYELKENGTAIYVPREKVYELRLTMMGEDIISDGPLGDKLFDTGALGMTNFMQKVNLRRALEGELARTIASLKQVSMARVHLVLPEKRAFSDSQSPATASVVLQLSGNSALTESQILGITSLVAGAVEGMTPADVTLLDTRGNLLSNPNQNDTDVMLTSTQLQMQRDVEAHLTENGQSMLDRVLGQGNAIVRVAATLDFTRSLVETKNIDPESATVISEERLEENSDVDTAKSSVKNYELSETRARTEKSVGELSYLTVSVILNQKMTPPPEDDPEARPQPRPYTAEELAEIESLVKNAVGFREERGDQFAIYQTVFDNSINEQIAADFREQQFNEQMQLYVRYGLMAIAILLALWLMRSAARRTTELVHGPSQTAASSEQAALGEGPDVAALQSGTADKSRQLTAHKEEEFILVEDIYTSKLSAEAKARIKAKHKLFEEIKDQIAKHPEDTAELLISWMAEDLQTVEV
ncbi:flagellar basal-body MS-ring/collar protein FliF [Rhodocaloribacter sp.]